MMSMSTKKKLNNAESSVGWGVGVQILHTRAGQLQLFRKTEDRALGKPPVSLTAPFDAADSYVRGGGR